MPKISALPPMTTADAADEAPIVDTSVATTKKWTLTLLKTYLQTLTSWITTAMLADASVTKAKMVFSSGIWWEELGRNTLTPAGDTISVTGLTAKKYLRVMAYSVPTGGSADHFLRFNNDTAGNYARRVSDNGGADNTGGTGQAGLALDNGSIAVPMISIVDIINVSAQEKLVFSENQNQNTAGAANVPSRRMLRGKWANTSAQITRIDFVNIGGTGDYAIGSEVVVLGHD